METVYAHFDEFAHMTLLTLLILFLQKKVI